MKRMKRMIITFNKRRRLFIKFDGKLLIQLIFLWMMIMLPDPSSSSSLSGPSSSFSYLRRFSFFNSPSSSSTATSSSSSSSSPSPPSSVTSTTITPIPPIVTVGTIVENLNEKLTTTNLPNIVSTNKNDRYFYKLENINNNNESIITNQLNQMMLNDTMVGNTVDTFFSQFLGFFYNYQQTPGSSSTINSNIIVPNKTNSSSLLTTITNVAMSETNNHNKPFEVVIKNDKSIAHLIFDRYGREVTYCELYDLERQPPMIRLPIIMTKYKPMLVDYKTMLEAVRRCTALHLDKFYQEQPPLTNNNNQTIQDQSNSIASTPDPSISNVTLVKIGLNQTANEQSTTPVTTIRPQLDSQLIWTFGRGILPGTKWCGLGDLAEDYTDLGFKTDIDICCRAHDHCPVRLKGFRSGYGIFNFSFYSRLYCECDEDFYQCLKKSPKNYAQILGNIYFNVLRIQCLKEDLTPIPVGSSSSSSSSQQKICLKRKKTKSGIEECLEYGIIPDSNHQMRLVSFGRRF